MLYEQQQEMVVDLRHKIRPLQVEVVDTDCCNNNDHYYSNNMEIVDLSRMSLDSLPNPPIHLENICKLDLSSNNLQNIPESLTARLLNVIILDVRSNQLKSLPNSIGCLTKLRILNVSGNLMTSLPKTIGNCRSLEDLNANFNQLERLPDTIGSDLQNLKKLSVNSNKLLFLPQSTSQLTNLRILDARLNRLRALPDDLENLINLEVLNVSQNFHHLSSLPYSIGLLISLRELDISYNKIAALPDSIGCLKRLQKLNVEGNPLASPPPEVMEQGLPIVKEYLCDKINGKHVAGCSQKQKQKQSSSWLGKLAKCGTFNGGNVPVEERDGYMMPAYRSIDGMTSPRYMGMFSPRKLFSPKSYFSR